MLFISAHFPSLSSGYAGHKTAYMFLEEYDHTSQVDLVVIANGDEVKESDLINLKNTRLLYVERLTAARKIKNIFFSKWLFPLKVQSRFSRSVLSVISESIPCYDVIHFEFSHAAALLKQIIPFKNHNAQIVVSSHDVLTQSLLRLSINNLFSFMFRSLDLYATIKFEAELYRTCNNIIVQSDKDAKLLESLFSVPYAKIKVVPPYISPFVKDARKMRIKQQPDSHSLLFWGAMNRRENEEAILIFVKKYRQLLDQLGITLYIVGNAPSIHVKALASDKIVVTGFVEDPTPFFAKCTMGIVPLLTGAGIKVKTLEMLESGMRVLSTPVGAEGIEHTDLIISELDGFGDKLCILFDNHA